MLSICMAVLVSCRPAKQEQRKVAVDIVVAARNVTGLSIDGQLVERGVFGEYYLSPGRHKLKGVIDGRYQEATFNVDVGDLTECSLLVKVDPLTISGCD